MTNPFRRLFNRLTRRRARHAEAVDPEPDFVLDEEMSALALRMDEHITRLRAFYFPNNNPSPSPAEIEVRTAAIRSLFPPVTIEELPNDARDCVICQQRYGEGEDECPEPVRLTCCAPATAGLACLVVWLGGRSGDGNGGTCPLCRWDWREEVRRAVKVVESADAGGGPGPGPGSNL